MKEIKLRPWQADAQRQAIDWYNIKSSLVPDLDLLYYSVARDLFIF